MKHEWDYVTCHESHGNQSRLNTCPGKRFDHSFLLKIETTLVAIQGASDGAVLGTVRSWCYSEALWGNILE